MELLEIKLYLTLIEIFGPLLEFRNEEFLLRRVKVFLFGWVGFRVSQFVEHLLVARIGILDRVVLAVRVISIEAGCTLCDECIEDNLFLLLVFLAIYLEVVFKSESTF